MKHAIANPDSNVIANPVKHVIANPVKHVIANPVKHMIANSVNSFLKFALLEKFSVFIFLHIHVYIYTGEKTIYTVILTKLLHIVNDRFCIPNKQFFSYMIMARTSYIRYMIIMSSLSLLFLESTSYHTRVGHCPCT